jgi:hypothetical protein
MPSWANTNHQEATTIGFLRYVQTAEFIRRLPEPVSIAVNGKIPFTCVTEIAQAKLPQDEKIKLISEWKENPTDYKIL